MHFVFKNLDVHIPFSIFDLIFVIFMNFYKQNYNNSKNNNNNNNTML